MSDGCGNFLAFSCASVAIGIGFLAGSQMPSFLAALGAVAVVTPPAFLLVVVVASMVATAFGFRAPGEDGGE